ncbi:lysozyme [Salmonella enterica subsp. enterica serovar Apapa]|nr:lysozyme [Salmonella enterica subsp. enterica serovar Apapa]EEJ2775926.1 lysozyme [Salmonella enterica subsp. enterica serovar Apapa]EIW2877486.1 lysozyme [Salmonella enterica subsp. enterica serovar Apapa]EJQ8573321.1 lysozyme [Salmonella enterica subsp. enterica serovar Apapa]
MSSIVKRCSVAAVLVLAALMPDFRLLNTSPDGLALIADLEGCRLAPYQCSAGVWTSGIGHTAGVVPKSDITEREAAANLVADVLNTERRLAVCVPVTMPQPVYDALVSFSFNVGTGAACRSTLVSYIKRHQWWQACDQLTRWVYVNGTKNKGLENRRARELAYCMKGVTQ